MPAAADIDVMARADAGTDAVEYDSRRSARYPSSDVSPSVTVGRRQRFIAELRRNAPADRGRVRVLAPAAIARVTYVLAARIAATRSSPSASRAAMADDNVQPVPWV